MNCPSPSALREYCLGRLEADVAVSIAEHIEICAVCLEKLGKEESADSLVNLLRASAANGSQVATEVFQVRTEIKALDSFEPGSTLGLIAAGEADTPPISNSYRPNKPSLSIKQIGDYEIIEEIARGGMGVVYKARQQKLNRIVAIKMILAGQFACRDEIERFYREAKAAAQLDHRGIVPIYEVGQCEEKHFFSMGFVDGKSLEDRLAAGPLANREAAALLAEICEAVQYAHERGIIHRDLKPRNILLDVDGSPRITDFGLAKNIQAEAGLTVSGQILGTPGYMPPEQASGKPSEMGPSCDVYSLGAVLYCCLTGRPPFRSESVVETIKQVLETPPQPPRSHNRKIDKDLETICLKCLEKNPRHRYLSVLSLKQELRRYLSGEPIHARPIGPVTRAVRWVRRHPSMAATAALFALCIVAVPLVGVVAQRASSASRFASMQSKFESTLSVPRLNQEWLDELDGYLSQISAHDPRSAQEGSRRVIDTWEREVRRQLAKPRLEPSEISDMEVAIKLVSQRSPEVTLELGRQLEQRKSDWQPILRLSPPFDGFTSVLSDSAIKQDAEKLLHESEDHLVYTSVRSDGAVKFEARFDHQWEHASRLGIGIKSHNNLGYRFLLQADDTQVTQYLESIVSAKSEGFQFSRVREQDGYFTLVIYRNELPLIRRSFHHSQVAAGPLVIRGSYENTRLRMEVNSLPATVIRDPFPISSSEVGTFAIEWPKDVGLLSLEASRKLKPQDKSPLERADELFESQQFQEALEQYQIQAQAALDSDLAQEVRYKQALCELKLGHVEDATQLLAIVCGGEGDRWPPLAGCHLWLQHLRAKRRESADQLFDELSARFDFSQIAELIPLEIRAEILANYQSGLSTVSELLRPDQDRLSRVRRFTAIDRFLSPTGRGRELNQMDAARAYELEGDLGGAVEVAAEIARESVQATVVRHYLRLLRLNGQTELALRELEEYERKPIIPGRSDLVFMKIELARIYSAMDDWANCENALDRASALMGGNGDSMPEKFSYYALMKGMLQHRRGEMAGAMATWKSGYEPMRSSFAKFAHPTTSTINAAILGSLSHEMREDEAQAFFNCLFNRGGETPFLRQIQSGVSPATIANALTQMWRSKLGMQCAEDLAFERLDLRNRMKTLAALSAQEYFCQSAFGQAMSDRERVAVFDLARQGWDSFLVETASDKRMSLTQGGAILLAWKFPETWSVVRLQSPAQLRGGVGYLFAHRLLTAAKPNTERAVDALEHVSEDSPEGSEIAELAATDLRRLREMIGVVTISKQDSRPATLDFLRENEIVQSIQTDRSMELEIRAGRYHLTSPNMLEIEPLDIHVKPGCRVDIRLK